MLEKACFGVKRNKAPAEAESLKTRVPANKRRIR
jgi:hypothetical protein